jgi:hypothetical protein
MRRRQFLTSTGLLWAMSLSRPVIAAPLLEIPYKASTGRKLALLIGINDYGSVRPLKGCLTDVEVQRELLIHRYGFQPNDIIAITDRSATSDNIHNAITEHFIKQVKPDDVVVFHFSGYGGILESLPHLVLADAQYLSLNTLLQYWQSLPTDKITTIIDTGFTSNQFINPCGLVDRTYPHTLTPKDSPTFTSKSIIRKGILLSASSGDNTTLELGSDRWNYGLFTQLLANHLWSTGSPNTLNICFQEINRNLSSLDLSVTPELTTTRSKREKNSLPYYLSPTSDRGIVGTITAVNPHSIILWLGGLKIHQDLTYHLTVNDHTHRLLTIDHPDQLNYQLTVEDSTIYQPGDFLREQIRLIPVNLGLNLGFADRFSLGNCDKIQRIERVEATSVFSGVPSIQYIVDLTEKDADILLTKVPEVGYQLIDRWGKVLSKEYIHGQSSIKSLVKTSASQLNDVLAIKLCKLTENIHTSNLPIKLTVETVSTIPSEVYCQATSVFPGSCISSIPDHVPQVNHSKLRWQIDSNYHQPIYFIILAINSKNQIFFNKLPSDHQCILPQQKQELELNTISDRGIVNNYLIMGVKSFDRFNEAVTTELSKTDNFNYGLFTEPLHVLHTILTDLSTQSESSQEFYQLNNNYWLTMNIVYQSV